MLEIIRATKFAPQFVRTQANPRFASPECCAETLQAYRSGQVDGGLSDATVWGIHTAKAQRNFLKILDSGTADEMAAYLSGIHEQAVLRGYDQHSGITAKLDSDEKTRANQARNVFGALVRLASSLGVVRQFKAEQPENYDYLLNDKINEMCRGISKSLQFKGNLPETSSGAYGLSTDIGVMSFRQVFALGYLREIRNILR